MRRPLPRIRNLNTQLSSTRLSGEPLEQRHLLSAVQWTGLGGNLSSNLPENGESGNRNVE